MKNGPIRVEIDGITYREILNCNEGKVLAIYDERFKDLYLPNAILIGDERVNVSPVKIVDEMPELMEIHYSCKRDKTPSLSNVVARKLACLIDDNPKVKEMNGIIPVSRMVIDDPNLIRIEYMSKFRLCRYEEIEISERY